MALGFALHRRGSPQPLLAIRALHCEGKMQVALGAGDVATGRIKSSRYRPPADWVSWPLADLVKGTARDDLSAQQMSLLGPPKSVGDQVPIFLAGDTSLLRQRAVSVIGTRQVSEAGAARARRVARELVAHNVVIVSGLADGVDTQAMTSTIRSGGRTIGVIGTPLDTAYPAANRALQEEVYAEHLLVSQFSFGARVFRSNFPQRNRLMAMISDATVVIEASDTSGTLHQAAECTRLGRWLFIAKSVVENPALSWPAKFLDYKKCRVLQRTEDIITAVYSG